MAKISHLHPSFPDIPVLRWARGPTGTTGWLKAMAHKEKEPKKMERGKGTGEGQEGKLK